jgi:hypothetical protein
LLSLTGHPNCRAIGGLAAKAKLLTGIEEQAAKGIICRFASLRGDGRPLGVMSIRGWPCSPRDKWWTGEGVGQRASHDTDGGDSPLFRMFAEGLGDDIPHLAASHGRRDAGPPSCDLFAVSVSKCQGISNALCATICNHYEWQTVAHRRTNGRIGVVVPQRCDGHEGVPACTYGAAAAGLGSRVAGHPMPISVMFNCNTYARRKGLPHMR